MGADRQDKGSGESRRQRVQRWLRRYGLAEAAAILGSYGGYFGAGLLGAGAIASAMAAAWCENIGFYSVMALRDAMAAPPGRRWRTAGLLLLEFGPAELLDSLLLRPAAVAASVALLGPGWGVLAGKLIADAAFYALVIMSHEHLRKREGLS